MAHVASVRIDTNLMFSDVYIETTGGASPIRCHGHRKADAVRMKQLIERYQTEYYRGEAYPRPVRSPICSDRICQSESPELPSPSSPASAPVVPEGHRPIMRLVNICGRSDIFRPPCDRRQARDRERSRHAVPEPGAIPASRRHPPISERAARRKLRRRSADADVRPPAAGRRELHPRAGRLRRRARPARHAGPLRRRASGQPGHRQAARQASSSGAPRSAPKISRRRSSASGK